jgi:hypothetical protein
VAAAKLDMKIKDLGTIVAERVLEGQDKGNPCKVIVKIGKPFPDENGEGCWYCPYSIAAGDHERIFYGAGNDSLQALRITISNIGAELSTIYAGLNLTWMGETDLGFSFRA